MAWAMTCSELTSTAATLRRSVFSSQSARLTTSVTPNSPLVRVPVLSKTTTSSRRAVSVASALRMSIPLRAPSEVEMVVTTGMASPRAWGQAMTSTVTAKVSANTVVCPAMNSQNRKAAAATATAMIVSQWAARSASR